LSSNNYTTSTSISTLNQLKTKNLPKLKLSKTAKSTILTNQIRDFIVADISKIPNFETLKTDLELIKHICNMIENLEKTDLDPKIDKKAIALDVIKSLFPDLTTDQTMFIDSFIDFVVSNSMVSKMSTMTNILGSIKNGIA
jgi:hypothetical protein